MKSPFMTTDLGLHGARRDGAFADVGTAACSLRHPQCDHHQPSEVPHDPWTVEGFGGWSPKSAILDSFSVVFIDMVTVDNWGLCGR